MNKQTSTNLPTQGEALTVDREVTSQIRLLLVVSGGNFCVKSCKNGPALPIDQTFEALLKLVQELDNEASRAVREGLVEESLAMFDLLKKPGIGATEIKQIKDVAGCLI